MWISFKKRKPKDGWNVAVWDSLSREVTLVEGYDRLDASNNWTMWFRIPDPSQQQIDKALRLHEVELVDD